MDEPYLNLDINTLPGRSQWTSMGTLLLMRDNLDKPIDWDVPGRFDDFGVLFKLHTMSVLFFCLGGEVTLKAGTEQYTMHRGDVQLTKSGLFGAMTGMTRDVRFAAVLIDEKFYFPVVSGTDVSALHRRLAARPICTLAEDSLQECVAIYRLMKNRIEREAEDALQEQILRGYAQALVLNVYSQYLMSGGATVVDDNAKQSQRQQELFSRFMALLQRDYTRERNIKYYADELCVTPRYLSRVVHDVSGLFASDHIDHFVIDEAKQLIRSKRYTILQVSEMLNFTSPSFFTRYFKKMTGFTPKQYEEMG